MSVVTLDGGAIPTTDPVSLEYNYVDPAFFDTLDVPVMRGRGFSDEDALEGRPVTLINETAARQSFSHSCVFGCGCGTCRF